MPHYIKSLYRYFCKNSFEALRRFYNWKGSRGFVKRYGVQGRKFCVRFVKISRGDDAHYQALEKYYNPAFAARAKRKK